MFAVGYSSLRFICYAFAVVNLQEPKEEGDEDEDENDDEEEKDKKVDQEFLVCAFDCLGQSWPKSATDSQGDIILYVKCFEL